MHVAVDLDEELLSAAQKATGLSERTALIHAGLKALIERESARRLARLGGSGPQLASIRRRHRRAHETVDTSIWIEHPRRRDPVLEADLDASDVLMQTVMIGELACGNRNDDLGRAFIAH